jgi:hypothetical protein
MARKKFKGDDEHRLPSQQIEPYRLWFEFLKLALKDPSIKVKKNIYRSWGDLEGPDFREWFETNWRKLFAVDIGISLFNPEADLSTPNERELIVRIPLYQDPKRSLVQISELLKSNGASEKLKNMADGQFRLQVGTEGHPSTRFLRNLPKVRLLLNIYRYWLSHEGLDEKERLEQTAISYYEWANGWNTKVRERNWKRSLIDLPYAINVYVQYLHSRGSKKKIRLYGSEIGDVSDHRRQIARYIRKARQIATNVAEGQFPGVYE